MKSLLNKKIHIFLTVLIRFNLAKPFPFLFHCAFSHLFLWHFLSSKHGPLLCSLFSLLFPPIFLPMFLHSSIHLPFIFPVLQPYGPPAVSDILSPASSIDIRLYTTGLQENINVGRSTKRHNISEILKAQWLTGIENLLFSRGFDAVG